MASGLQRPDLRGDRSRPLSAKQSTVLRPAFEVEVKHLMVPTRGGDRLSANLFRPVTDRPVPVAVEYTPYRKDDFRGAARDFGHFYLAERGIASVQLDVRGTGGSDGAVVDEYQYPQEQEDGYDALEWLAAQPWCIGKTGMWGTSYAGFTALQVAQFQPSSLGAIVPIYATDDRFSDDMHFRGGALNGWSVIGSYALGMVTRNALPPYPETVGGEWQAIWDRRLRENIPWLIRWLEEQLDGPYWRSTLARRYDQVRVPTLIIGGWADFYVSSALRWFEHLQVPRKLLMGPWPHTPPDQAQPGPRIDFMHEVARWFLHWLAGEDNGVNEEPPGVIFVQTSRRPDMSTDQAPGYWRFQDSVPPAGTMGRSWFLHPHRVVETSPPPVETGQQREYVPFVGIADLGFGGGRTGWGEQGANDAFSLVYTSEPLDADLEIQGVPSALLFVSAAAPVAFLAARLSDVAPDGAATLVTKGLLNLTRRAGLDRADEVRPSEVYELELELDATSWVFPKAHRLRLSVSGADFPEVWPSPHRGVIALHMGPSHPSAVTLPVVKGDLNQPTPHLLPPPQRRSQFVHNVEKPSTSISYEVERRTMTARRELHESFTHPDGKTTISGAHRIEMSVASTDPAQARAEAWDRRAITRPGFEVESTARATLQGTADHFILHLWLDVAFNGTPYHHQEWNKTIPRRLL